MIRFKSNKSDLNFKKSDFFIFFLNRDFYQPCLHCRVKHDA